jgi:hypothetical protein
VTVSRVSFAAGSYFQRFRALSAAVTSAGLPPVTSVRLTLPEALTIRVMRTIPPIWLLLSIGGYCGATWKITLRSDCCAYEARQTKTERVVVVSAFERALIPKAYTLPSALVDYEGNRRSPGEPIGFLQGPFICLTCFLLDRTGDLGKLVARRLCRLT